jgi:hypothetical protein
MSPEIQLKFIESMLEGRPKFEMFNILEPIFQDPLLIEKKIMLIDQIIDQTENNIILLKKQKEQIQKRKQ